MNIRRIIQLPMRLLILSLNLLLLIQLVHTNLPRFHKIQILNLTLYLRHHLIITHLHTHSLSIIFLLLRVDLLLPPLLQKLISIQSINHKEYMKQNKIKQQKPKNSHKYSSNPRKNDLNKLLTTREINFSTTNTNMNDDNKSKTKSREDANHERCIVPLTNTIIEPHTMMIEFVYTTITSSTMFAICHTVTITEFTIEHFVIFWCEAYLLVMP